MSSRFNHEYCLVVLLLSSLAEFVNIGKERIDHACCSQSLLGQSLDGQTRSLEAEELAIGIACLDNAVRAEHDPVPNCKVTVDTRILRAYT